MSRYLEAMLGERLGSGRSRTRKTRRATRDQRATRARIDTVLERANGALLAGDRRELDVLERALLREVRTALPTRSVTRTLAPATRLHSPRLRHLGTAARETVAASFEQTLSAASSTLNEELWLDFTAPTDQPRQLIRDARRLGLRVGSPTPATRLLGRRLGTTLVRLTLPPHPAVVAGAGRALSMLAGERTKLLVAGGLTLLPRRRLRTHSGFMTLEACRLEMGIGGDTFGLAGLGTLVATLDTGVDLRHPAFAETLADGRLAYRRVRGMGSDDDRDADDGHGSHVHGIACGAPADPMHRGLAPAARQLVVRVFEPGVGYAYNEDIIEGLSVATIAGADIINLSLGGTASPDSELGWICSQLVEQELALVVAAAGNSAYARPEGGVECPGNASGVLAVAALERERRIAGFSSRGRPGSTDEAWLKPDLAAFGVGIVAPAAGTDRWIAFDGTSMAAPLVTGFAACLLAEERGAGRSPSTRELRELLLGRCSREGLVGPGGGPFPMEGWNRWVGAGPLCQRD